MLKAIHAQESKKAAREKAKAVVAQLKEMKLKEKMKNSKHTKFDKKKLIGTVSKKHIKNGSIQW